MSIKPYCDCRSTGKWNRQDGWSHQLATGLWVHGTCQRPSRAFVTDEGTYTLTPRIEAIPIVKKEPKVHDEGWFTWT